MKRRRKSDAFKKRDDIKKRFHTAHYGEATRYKKFHSKAFIGDVHAHPGLKIAYFNRKFAPTPLSRAVNQVMARVLPFDPLGFDPLLFRTEYESLMLGNVRLVVATAVLPEFEGLEDVNRKPHGHNLLWILFWSIPVFALFFGGLKYQLLPITVDRILAIILMLILALLVNFLVALMLKGFGVNPKKLLLFVLTRVSGWDYLTNGRFIDYAKGTHSMMDLTCQSVGEGCPPPEKENKRRNQKKKNDDPYQGMFRFAVSPDDFRQAIDDIKARKLHTVFVHAIEGAYSLEGEATYEIIERAREKTDSGNRLHHSERERDPDLELVKDVLLNGHEVSDIQKEVIANLEGFAGRGLAILGLGHYHPNVVSNVVFPYPAHQLKGEFIDPQRWPWFYRDISLGLTSIGKAVIRRAAQLGVIIDLNHATPTARKQVYKILSRDFPDKKSDVIMSHTAAYALNPIPYCVKDWEIRWLAKREGLIGVMLSNYFLTGYADVKLGLRHVVRHIAHIRDVVANDKDLGPDMACDVITVATDFDGFSEPPDDFAFSAQWPRMTQRLVAQYEVNDKGKIVRAFSKDEIRKILGGNLRRVLLRGWGDTPTSTTTGVK